MQAAPCKRCLLQDMQDNDYYQSVIKYRQSLPLKEKTPDGEYKHRLAACRQCEQLVNGVCNQCGCYVEMRAAALRMRCPLSPKRW